MKKTAENHKLKQKYFFTVKYKTIIIMSIATQTIPSICIPRAHISVTEQQVEKTFDLLFGNGTVRDTDMLLREDYKTNELFWLIFVHFNDYCPEHDDSNIVTSINGFKKRITSGEEVRVEYNAPYFWKTYEATPPAQPDFENEEWEPVAENTDELEEMIEKMLNTAPENSR